MIGTTIFHCGISHYGLTKRLGKGAMGVVREVEETRLGRSVALRFPAPHLVSNIEEDRT